MSVEINGVEEVTTMLSGLADLPQKGINYWRLASQTKTIIDKRTRSGLDVHGKIFSPYSADYLEYKLERSEASFGLVDLIDYGNMLGAMTPKKTQKGSRLFFPDELQRLKAQGHDSGDGTNPRRQFFSLSEPEVDVVMKQAEKDIDKYMSKL